MPGSDAATKAAERLRTVLLRQHGIHADVNAGYGVAAISVWTDLVVWTNGRWFRWALRRSSATGRPLYAVVEAPRVGLAARLVARRYDELRRLCPWPEKGGALW